jgi:hypothetical protein
MAQTDYLLRMIEQAGRMLAELRRMILGGEVGPEDAETGLRNAAGHVGLDLDLLRTVSPDTLVTFMSPAGEPEPGRCWITAELFMVNGHREVARGDPDAARDCWERALRLYALLDPGIIVRGLPEVGERVRETQEALASLDRRLDRP